MKSQRENIALAFIQTYITPYTNAKSLTKHTIMCTFSNAFFEDAGS
jgi:hypothetical protein